MAGISCNRIKHPNNYDAVGLEWPAIAVMSCRMGWATHLIDGLLAGETVQARPRGGSMAGRIESGQLCTIEPVDHSKITVGDIVLCKVRGNEYLHIVKAIQGPKFQIGNNRGLINGWVGANAIFGICTVIED